MNRIMSDQLDQLDLLRTKLQNAVRKGKAIEADRNKLIDEHKIVVEELQSCISDLQTQNSSLLQQLLLQTNGPSTPPPSTTTADALKHLSQMNKELRKELEEAQEHVAAVEHRVVLATDGNESDDSALIIAELQDEIEVLKEALNIAALKIREFQKDEERNKKESLQLEIDIATLKKSLRAAEKTAITAHEDLRKEADKEKEDALGRIRILEEELQTTKQLLEDASRASVESKEELKVGMKKIEEAEERARSAEETTIVALNAAEERKADALRAVEKAEAMARTAQVELKEIKEISESKNQKFSVIQAAFNQKEEEFQERLLIAEKEKNAALDAAKKAEKDRESLQTLAENAEKERKEAIEDVNARVTTATTSLQAEIEALHDQLGQKNRMLEESLKVQETHFTNRIHELELTITSKNDEVQALQSTIDAFSTKDRNLEEQLQVATAKIASLEATKNDVIDRNAARKVQHTMDDGKEKELQHRVAEFEKKVSVAEALRAEVEKKNKELGWQIAMLANRQQQHVPSGAVAVTISQSSDVEHSSSIAKLTGGLLRYRKHLLMGYFFFLHALVYFVATKRVWLNL